MRLAALALVVLLVAGCGNATSRDARTATTTTTAKLRRSPEPQAAVAYIGDVPRVTKGVRIAEAELVVVGPGPRNVPALAAAYPDAHFVLVGRSYADAKARKKNVGGLLFRDDQAAFLAGVVAGLVTADQGVLQSTIAWVGTKRQPVVDAFERGAASSDPNVRVLDASTVADAARCKESALDAISRGATVVLAGVGACAEGALAGARDQNAVGLALSDFLRPRVAVAAAVRDAGHGVFHSGENVVFGAASGAVAVGRLDPRVPSDTILRARSVAQELATGLRSPG